MRILFFLLCLLPALSFAQEPKTIHVYVALCDNENQGIVPVNASLGNGQNPTTNLYWGAAYGLRTWFKRSSSWTLVETWANPETKILERLLFKHTSQNTYLLADAWDGKHIKPCIQAYVKASAGKGTTTISHNDMQLQFGGQSGLVAYVGHNGLMEFDVEKVQATAGNSKPTITLACAAKPYFSTLFAAAGAKPLVWTTGLMAPESYTLEAAIAGWLANETPMQVRERAAQAYNKYQKCGISGARRLFDKSS